MHNLIWILLFVILIVITFLVLRYVQKGNYEAFQHTDMPMSFGENQGIPLVFLSSMQAPENAYYKELNAKAITNLVSKANNILTIDAFLASINKWLPSFDEFTADVPFKVIAQKDMKNNTKQITIYRDGKMYGFVVEIVIGKGATVTGFILEQDIKVNSGYDPLGSNIRLYDSEPKEFARKDAITQIQRDIDDILRKQSDALLQDRGISSLALA